MNVLVINGHPRADSLSTAFTQAYAEGARQSGIEPEVLTVANLHFDINVTTRHNHEQEVEPDISRSRQLISWANHIVFIYPTWWGTIPALLKGFFDRVLVAGFAFEETEGGTGYEPLLRGRTAELITTMDTPRLVYQLIYRAPGHNAMRRSILGFCGFTVTRVMSFGPVKKADESKIASWIVKVKDRGRKLRRGTISTWKYIYIFLTTWIKAIRLQFYPMSFIAYTAGTFAAQQSGYGFDAYVYWLGYAWLFLVEVATVLSNDYFDFDSDRRNGAYGPFTGGSRVLVTGQINFGQMKRGIKLSLFASFILLLFLIPASSAAASALLLTCGAVFILALGYTIPPLKLCHRGLGELTVGLTHSFALIVCGYVFQGGVIFDSLPWFMSLPLFLAVLPSITLSGIPDHDADKEASKKTLAVKLGKKGAAKLALSFTGSSVAALLVFEMLEVLPYAFEGIIYGVLLHALLLGILLWRYIINKNPPVRIDGLMVASLTYLMWFAIVPLVHLR